MEKRNARDNEDGEEEMARRLPEQSQDEVIYCAYCASVQPRSEIEAVLTPSAPTREASAYSALDGVPLGCQCTKWSSLRTMIALGILFLISIIGRNVELVSAGINALFFGSSRGSGVEGLVKEIVPNTTASSSHQYLAQVSQVGTGHGLLERNETGSRVQFVPHPHRILGSGAQVQCQWETRPTANASKMDFTQYNAFNEGVCIPPALERTIHVFSSAEAIECLSTAAQKRVIRLIFSGDSYTKQLYIGMVDILLSKHVNGETEITNGRERNEFVPVARELVRKRLGAPNSTFPKVEYLCEHECYGREDLDECSECIDAFSGNNTGHVGSRFGSTCYD